MQTEPMLYNVWLLSAGLRAFRFTAPISALIYETQEECNEVKKNKGRGRENKQALHCDTEYAAVIELDLKKFTKTLCAPPLQFATNHFTVFDASLLWQ